MAEPQAEPQVDSIYRGGINQKSQQVRSAKELIDTEWQVIDKLTKIAERTRSEKTKAFYYQTLASHVRTLSMLLKLHAQPDNSQDLAKLLSEINTEATTIAKRLRQKCPR
jgi:5-bromo-4-chloroindolyl phosphate hydrolysis protein